MGPLIQSSSAKAHFTRAQDNMHGIKWFYSRGIYEWSNRTLNGSLFLLVRPTQEWKSGEKGGCECFHCNAVNHDQSVYLDPMMLL